MIKSILIGLVLALTLTQTFAYTSNNEIESKVTLLDSSLLDVVWCGNNQDNDNKVLILTSQGTVYKSSDRGDSWEKLSDLFQNSAIKSVNDLEAKVGYINRIIKSPVDPNVVTFLGTEGINFISEDCGNTIKSYGKGSHFREFSYHPYERNWVLASAWTDCKGLKASDKCSVTKELYFSENLGRTWEKLASYIVQFNWAVGQNKHLPAKRIMYSQEVGATGHQKINGWNMSTHLYYSDDLLKTSTILVSQGNKFLMTDQFVFVAQVRDAESQKVNLLYSPTDKVDYDFDFAQIPEEIKQHSFTILDSSEGSVFLNINHHKPNSPLGSIYKSNASEAKFVKSLDYNIRDPSDGQCDFERVSGVYGVYISNSYKQQQAQEYISAAQAEDADQLQIETTSTGKTKVVTNLKNFAQKLNDVRQTRITFDMGSVWQPLSPPAKDVKGQSITCDMSQGCSLHLHSVSSKMQYGPFYSSDNALGIVMGTGNVGKSLRSRKDQVNTYLSRDAGNTWNEVKKGSHIYEFADHGALILMADDQKATNFVYYSWDEGLTWSKMNFWENDVEITNIITEPSNIGQRFLVYGTTQVETNGTTKTQGVVINFDFGKLHQAQCAGADSPNSDSSDYELWSPKGKNGQECLMGAKVQYSRRKRLAKCFNGQDFDRVVSIDKCMCTEEDWECDYGYERVNGEGPCVLSEGQTEPSYDAPPVCNGYYEVTQGYRKMAGNRCTGGIDHSAYRMSCPSNGIFSSWTNILVLLAILYGVYYVYQNQEESLEQFTKLVGYITSLVQVSKNSGKDKKGGYIDFSQMDFEQNNMKDSSSFDEGLVEKKDEEDHYEKVGEEQGDLLDNNQKQQQQQNKEEVNLLDADEPLIEDDDGFDPNN